MYIAGHDSRHGHPYKGRNTSANGHPGPHRNFNNNRGPQGIVLFFLYFRVVVPLKKKKEKCIHPYLFIGREDTFQSGPAIDPVTFTLADTMRRKISGGNKWDQQLEGYLQKWVGLIPAPLVRRASAEAKKQLTWQLQEARKKKEREAATALLTTRIPVAPPLSNSLAASSTFVQQDTVIDAGGHHRMAGVMGTSGAAPLQALSMDVDALLLDDTSNSG